MVFIHFADKIFILRSPRCVIGQYLEERDKTDERTGSEEGGDTVHLRCRLGLTISQSHGSDAPLILSRHDSC